MNTLRFGAILALVAATTFACGGDDDDTTSGGAGSSNLAAAGDNAGGGDNDVAAGGAKTNAAALEIVGEYDDNFGGEQIITATDWNGASIVEYDNDANVVYTQNPDDAKFDPSKFAKTVYTQPTKAGEFYFCQVEYSADTLEDAKASTKMADESDLDGKGCGGFSWSKATPKK